MMKMTRRFYRIICQRVLHHLICFANSNSNSKQTVELHWNGTCNNSMLFCIFCPLSIVRNKNQKHQTKQNHHQKNQTTTECEHDCTSAHNEIPGSFARFHPIIRKQCNASHSVDVIMTLVRIPTRLKFRRAIGSRTKGNLVTRNLQGSLLG